MLDDFVLIGEAAAASGLPIDTIRFYEDRGLIAPERDDRGRRLFDPHLVSALGVIRMLRQVGFPLAEVADLLAARQPDASDDENLARVGSALDDLLAGITRRRAELDEAAELLDAWRGQVQQARELLASGRDPRELIADQ